MGYHAMLDIRDNPGADRERLLATALRKVIAELRLVDVADYVAFLRMEKYGNIADILDSCSQLHLAPGCLHFANGGEVHLAWASAPAIELDLRFAGGGAEVHFRLRLAAARTTISIDHFPPLDANETSQAQTARLKAALEETRLPKAG